MRLVLGMLTAGVLLSAGCQTTSTAGDSSKWYADSSTIVKAEKEKAEELSEEEMAKKQSLDAMLDDHSTVTLVDDETGDTKLVCKRISQIGTRLGKRKVCKTKREWEMIRQESEDMVEDTQRRRMVPITN